MTESAALIILAAVALVSTLVSVLVGPAAVWTFAAVVAIADVIDARR